MCSRLLAVPDYKGGVNGVSGLDWEVAADRKGF